MVKLIKKRVTVEETFIRYSIGGKTYEYSLPEFILNILGLVGLGFIALWLIVGAARLIIG